MKRSVFVLSVLGLSLLLFSCASLPPSFGSVTGFEKGRYLGTWFEIARYDFAFEKDLDNTTADYSLTDSGLIRVVNRGFNYKTQKWQEAKGKARFKGSDTVGALEVSFFGPFYAAYNVVALDADYRYALVAGSSVKYLWILSRTPTIPDEVKKAYTEKAKSLGYDLSSLIWVKQDKANR